MGYKKNEASVLCNIGLMFRGQGKMDKALNHLRQALEKSRELGYKYGEALVLGNIGLIYRDQGEVDKALEFLVQALIIFIALRSPNAKIFFNSMKPCYKSMGKDKFYKTIEKLGCEKDLIQEIINVMKQ